MPARLTLDLEKRLLQSVIALGCLVPIIAGAEGVWRGVGFLGSRFADLDNHFRYLSGLLLAIGLSFLSTTPKGARGYAAFMFLAGVFRAALHAKP